jgi:hypothetical protein
MEVDDNPHSATNPAAVGFVTGHQILSSALPLQSSSSPLQVSWGGTHAPAKQPDEQELEPVEPHEVVHGEVWFAQHAYPSSHVPSQSSS